MVLWLSVELHRIALGLIPGVGRNVGLPVDPADIVMNDWVAFLLRVKMAGTTMANHPKCRYLKTGSSIPAVFYEDYKLDKIKHIVWELVIFLKRY